MRSEPVGPREPVERSGVAQRIDREDAELGKTDEALVWLAMQVGPGWCDAYGANDELSFPF